MPSRNQWIVRVLAMAAILALGLSFAPISSAGCLGPMYIYYETSALQTETGAKLVCPTGTYYDSGPDGTFQETPFFEVYTVSCPCSGGGTGGGDPTDAGED
ncbi:MAG: hypothetical protein AAGC60_13660 [Acidobacteriota bacterium]